jgi:phospholipid/cholesterol/gamma-HCH transport system ATP-binding protein
VSITVETPLIEFRDVIKRFDGRTVLDQVNLKIFENQITTIMGKSGTGKSVLLKHIIGLLSPDAGTILFMGKSINQMKKGEWDQYRSQVSYLFQNNALFDSMTVFDNIAMPLRQTTTMSPREIKEKVMARIEQTELTEAVDKYPSELSGGMQKRVALARALVTDPKIVLFDEPTAGQDPIRRNTILSTIAQYRRKFGFTAVLVSHDIPNVFFISDRLIFLWEGEVAFQGSYEETTRLKHPMVKEFLQSIEGFKDELTGLLSKQMFERSYSMSFNRGQREKKVTAVLFSVQFDLLSETLGPLAATEVLKALGEYINSNLSILGGFSFRNQASEILAILPNTDFQEARQLIGDFGKGLQQEKLANMQALTHLKIGADACFEIFVHAGIAEAGFDEDIDMIIEKARRTQETIATYRCGQKDGEI